MIAGWGHSAVVCGNGDVYICGRYVSLFSSSSYLLPHLLAFFLLRHRFCARSLPVFSNFQGQLGLGDPKNFERNERNHPYLAHFRVITGNFCLPFTPSSLFIPVSLFLFKLFPCVYFVVCRPPLPCSLDPPPVVRTSL